MVVNMIAVDYYMNGISIEFPEELVDRNAMCQQENEWTRK